MTEPLFKIEDRGNGYRFVSCPEHPGFTGMLKPGELWIPDDHIRSLIMLICLDAAAAERERCAKIADEEAERRLKAAFGWDKEPPRDRRDEESYERFARTNRTEADVAKRIAAAIRADDLASTACA